METEYGAPEQPLVNNTTEAPETKVDVKTPGGPSVMSKLTGFLSKKLAAFVFTAILIWANNQFSLGMDEVQIKEIVAASIAYILGQTAVDVTKAVKENK